MYFCTKFLRVKRIGTIITIAVLALTIVYLGAGTVVVECMKSNTITMGMADMDDCCNKGQDDCKHNSPCMKTTIVKLQPTVVAKQMVKLQVPVLSMLPLFCVNSYSPVLSVRTIHDVIPKVNPPNGPPRLYLAIIRVLII